MITRPREDQQDCESELLFFLMSLPEKSKFRSFGANGYEHGCIDRIITFNSARCGGASPGLFLTYVHHILLNRFRNLEKKNRSNPLTRKGAVRLAGEADALLI